MIDYFRQCSVCNRVYKVADRQWFAHQMGKCKGYSEELIEFTQV